MVKDEPIDAEEAEVDRKPGQKYPTPSQGSADRVFYESLYRQKPQSEMAQDWCIAYGVLPHNEVHRSYIVNLNTVVARTYCNALVQRKLCAHA
jgi:hypothetical protein